MVEWRSPKPQVGGSKPSWPANTCVANMNSKIEKTNNTFSALAWAVIALITVLGFVGQYKFNFSTPILIIMWIGWLILTLFFMYFTTQGKQMFEFALQSKIEMQKVVWPERKETLQTTSIVMIMVTVTGFVLWAVDVSMMWAIGKITHLG